MIVINHTSYRKGLVVGETAKSYKVRTISRTDSWMPKAQCRIDFNFYEAQLAMHLWHGYASDSVHDLGSIDIVAKISAFVPSLILADRKLDAQIEAGRDYWTGVFAYDVAQAAGAWLAANPNATVEQFTAKLEELIA